ncbi:Retrovirus-related Pol polyprotein from transposon [Zancudomyces culisetae]|uniref:Retrovirus-related Pol polyprotein from transposon n=1 Tax=Zancudomyces culisetae TaxID=1213189 RepID=A0A1R1PSM3_ZANCU|nr:Retrovirus-related Pol polyprotein from transposon [Zancudomyces culisetae]|eukprot:OMH83944.1 Retrovirus-related Pol polyprotein from transposon [Zancudomyces culisetae]
MELEKLWKQVGIKEEVTKLGSLVSTFSDDIRERLSDKEGLDREAVLKLVAKLEQSTNGRRDIQAAIKSSKPTTKNAATRSGKSVKELTTEAGQFGEFLKTFQELSVSLLEKLDQTVASTKNWGSQAKVERASTWECYYCHEKGHRKFECPRFQKEHEEKKVNFLSIGTEPTEVDEVLMVEKRKATDAAGRVGRPAKIRNTGDMDAQELRAERVTQPESGTIDRVKKFSLREELEKVYPKISMIQLLQNSEKIAQDWKNIVEVSPQTALNEIRIQEKATTNCSMTVEIYQLQWKAVVDTGAACSVITTGALNKIGLEPNMKSSHVIITADGKRHETLGVVSGVPIMISKIEFVASLVVLGNMSPTIILGMDWLLKHKASLNLAVPELRLPVDRAEVVTPLVTTKEAHTVEETWDLYFFTESPTGIQGDGVAGLEALVQDYNELFVDDIDKLKQTNVAEHSIVLTDNRPIKQRPYRIPFRLQEEVGKEIDRMLEQNVIAPKTTEEESIEVYNIWVNKESLVRQFLLDGTLPQNVSEELAGKIKKKSKSYKQVGGKIYRWVKGQLKEVLTAEESIDMIKKAHDDTHEGIENTWVRVSRNHYAKGLYKQVVDYVKRCHVCQVFKDGRSRKHPLVPVHAVKPFEIFGMDAIGPINPISESGNRYILTAIDYCTKWPIAIPVENLLSETIVDFIINNIVTYYGVPQKIITDRGSSFVSNVTTEVFNWLQLDHSPTTSYRPQNNGQCERLNKTLVNLLQKICRKDKNNWDRYLWKVLLIMRTMESKSTGYTPAEMMYGTEMCIPSTWKSNGVIEDEVEQVKSRLELMKSNLPQIRKIGVRKAVAAKESEKVRYNKTVKFTKFQVGEKVLKLVEYERGKLESLWEGPYTVMKRFTKGAYLISDQFGNRDLVNGDLLKKYHESKFMIPEISNRLRPKLLTFKQAQNNEGIIA